MGLRYYLCPVIGDGQTVATRYRSKISDIANPVAELIQRKTDGTPRFNWCIAIVRQATWTAVDADVTLENLFGIDLPDTIDTYAELKAFLKTQTVGDIPAARRQAINDKLIAREIDTSEITTKTTLWQVLRGIYKYMNNGALPINDDVLVV